jgi:hypothetical protein
MSLLNDIAALEIENYIAGSPSPQGIFFHVCSRHSRSGPFPLFHLTCYPVHSLFAVALFPANQKKSRDDLGTRRHEYMV